MTSALSTLERYYDDVPRANADALEVGPFTLFVTRVPWAYYARPRLDLHDEIGPRDVRALLAQQDELSVPHAIEWVAETTPSLRQAVEAVGLRVEVLPLLVLGEPVAPRGPNGMIVRLLTPGHADVALAHAIAAVAFSHGGTAAGVEGVVERDRALDEVRAGPAPTATDDLLRRGLMAGAIAVDTDGRLGGGAIASGLYNRRDAVAEIVAVAVLPAARRRGVAGALTAVLAEHARADGANTVFLSAGSQAVADVYRRIGFVDVGTACVAGD